MRKNKNTWICGKKIILVPYKKEHVERYHEWMKKDDLRKLTGSEYLTLPEEYTMCQNWQDDENKCTFIILSMEKFKHQNETEAMQYCNCAQSNKDNCFNSSKNEVSSMIGDINLFISYKDDGDEFSELHLNQPLKMGEINLMIADEMDRGKGYGTEAILLMMKYGIEVLDIALYFVKINTSNKSSLNLFQKLGFKNISKSEIFQEITMFMEVTRDFAIWLEKETLNSQIINKDFNTQCLKFCFSGSVD